MQTLSTNLATHYASVSTGKDTSKNIPLSKEMAETLRANLKQWYHTQYMTIPKIDDPLGEPAWEGRAWDVVIKKNELWTSKGVKYICDFATRHPINDSCNCVEEYRMPAIVFRHKLNELYPKKNTTTITPEEKEKILSDLRKLLVT